MNGEFKDIVYAAVDGRDQLLDLYLPAGVKEPPLVVWIHGGAWQSGSRSDPPMVFVEAGYALASVDFRLSADAVFPAQLNDILAAVRYLHTRAADYGYCSRRTVLAGFSSGGHLAALLGIANGCFPGGGEECNREKDAAVQAVIVIAGPANLLTILEQSTPHGLNVRQPAMEQLLGGSLNESEIREKARLASPVHHVKASGPPILIMHGVQDNQVPVNQAIELHQACEANRLDSRLVLVPDAGHFDDVYFRDKCGTIMVEFLNRVLRD